VASHGVVQVNHVEAVARRCTTAVVVHQQDVVAKDLGQEPDLFQDDSATDWLGHRQRRGPDDQRRGVEDATECLEEFLDVSLVVAHSVDAVPAFKGVHTKRLNWTELKYQFRSVALHGLYTFHLSSVYIRALMTFYILHLYCLQCIGATLYVTVVTCNRHIRKW